MEILGRATFSDTETETNFDPKNIEQQPLNNIIKGSRIPVRIILKDGDQLKAKKLSGEVKVITAAKILTKPSRIPIRILSKTDQDLKVNYESGERTNEKSMAVQRLKENNENKASGEGMDVTVKENLLKPSEMPSYIGEVEPNQGRESTKEQEEEEARLSDIDCSVDDVQTEATRVPVLTFNEEVRLARYKDLKEEIKPLKTYSGSNLRNFRRRRRLTRKDEALIMWWRFLDLFKCCVCGKEKD